VKTKKNIDTASQEEIINCNPFRLKKISFLWAFLFVCLSLIFSGFSNSTASAVTAPAAPTGFSVKNSGPASISVSHANANPTLVSGYFLYCDTCFNKKIQLAGIDSATTPIGAILTISGGELYNIAPAGTKLTLQLSAYVKSGTTVLESAKTATVTITTAYPPTPTGFSMRNNKVASVEMSYANNVSSDIDGYYLYCDNCINKKVTINIKTQDERIQLGNGTILTVNGSILTNIALPGSYQNFQLASYKIMCLSGGAGCTSVESQKTATIPLAIAGVPKPTGFSVQNKEAASISVSHANANPTEIKGYYLYCDVCRNPRIDLAGIDDANTPIGTILTIGGGYLYNIAPPGTTITLQLSAYSEMLGAKFESEKTAPVTITTTYPPTPTGFYATTNGIASISINIDQSSMALPGQVVGGAVDGFYLYCDNCTEKKILLADFTPGYGVDYSNLPSMGSPEPTRITFTGGSLSNIADQNTNLTLRLTSFKEVTDCFTSDEGIGCTQSYDIESQETQPVSITTLGAPKPSGFSVKNNYPSTPASITISHNEDISSVVDGYYLYCDVCYNQKIDLKLSSDPVGDYPYNPRYVVFKDTATSTILNHSGGYLNNIAPPGTKITLQLSSHFKAFGKEFESEKSASVEIRTTYPETPYGFSAKKDNVIASISITVPDRQDYYNGFYLYCDNCTEKKIKIDLSTEESKKQYNISSGVNPATGVPSLIITGNNLINIADQNTTLKLQLSGFKNTMVCMNGLNHIFGCEDIIVESEKNPQIVTIKTPGVPVPTGFSVQDYGPASIAVLHNKNPYYVDRYYLYCDVCYNQKIFIEPRWAQDYDDETNGATDLSINTGGYLHNIAPPGTKITLQLSASFQAFGKEFESAKTMPVTITTSYPPTPTGFAAIQNGVGSIGVMINKIERNELGGIGIYGYDGYYLYCDNCAQKKILLADFQPGYGIDYSNLPVISGDSTNPDRIVFLGKSLSDLADQNTNLTLQLTGFEKDLVCSNTNEGIGCREDIIESQKTQSVSIKTPGLQTPTGFSVKNNGPGSISIEIDRNQIAPADELYLYCDNCTEKKIKVADFTPGYEVDPSKVVAMNFSDTKITLTGGALNNIAPPGTKLTLQLSSFYKASLHIAYESAKTMPVTITTAYPPTPAGFIRVPGSATYGTKDFFVMKYEAKKDTTGKAISAATGLPWVNINQSNASTAANNACYGCRLMSEAEWMTLAQNVLSVPSNWTSGTVGQGSIYQGSTNQGLQYLSPIEASSDDRNGYLNIKLTGWPNDPTKHRRTLLLNNGEVIWDMSGNVEEWTSGQTKGGQPGRLPVPSQGIDDWYFYKQYKYLTAPGNLAVNILPSGTGIAGSDQWTSENGIGVIYSNSKDTTNTVGFKRGGFYLQGGVLTLDLTSPSSASKYTGFRVVSPVF